MSNLGTRIVELRRRLGLTQEKLAASAGLKSKGYLSRIERGERQPSLAVLERLADALGVKVRDLLIHPAESDVDAAMELIREGGAELARRVLALGGHGRSDGRGDGHARPTVTDGQSDGVSAPDGSGHDPRITAPSSSSPIAL